MWINIRLCVQMIDAVVHLHTFCSNNIAWNALDFMWIVWWEMCTHSIGLRVDLTELLLYLLWA